MEERVRVALHGALNGFGAVVFVMVVAVGSMICILIPLLIIANLGWLVGLPLVIVLTFLVAGTVGAIAALKQEP